MRLGISSYTFVWAAGVPGYPAPPQPLTIQALLNKAREFGVRVVQIADNLPLDRLSDPELDALLTRAQDMQIDLEVGTCGIRPEHVRRYIALAARLRSPILRVVADTEQEHPTSGQIVESVEAVLPDLERARVCLAIENHDRFPARVLAEICARFDSPHVGICLDTANSIGCLENLETVLCHLARWTVNLHIKDYEIFRPPHRKGFVVEGRPAGRGQLNIPWLLEKLREANRDPNAILELWPAPEDDIGASIAKEDAWAKDSVQYLRQFVSA